MDPRHDADLRQENAAFAGQLITGSANLLRQSVLVCVPLLYDAVRLDHVWRTLRALSAIVCRRMDIILLTDPLTDAQRQVLETLVAPLSDSIAVRAEAGLEDPHRLPWRHKRVLTDIFLDPHNGYDLFVYVEDDIVVTSANLAYFSAWRDPLDTLGFVPSFVRCEFNRRSHALHAVDQVWPQHVAPHQVIACGHTAFANLHFPFCAMYIMDQALAREHVATPSFDEQLSKGRMNWPTLERASLGQMFERLPPGAPSRYLVPFNRVSSRLMPACIVHHAADKYANLEGVHGQVPIGEVIVSDRK